jgi:hypothetical protein
METRAVRFLQEPGEMAVLRRHYIKGAGYIHCNGSGCPLCQKASDEWGAPITIARDYFLAVLIDRTDDMVRVFEGGKTIKNKLLNFSRVNGLTEIDFNLRRSEGKKGKDLYDLIPIVKAPSPLTKEERERIKEVALDRLLKRGEKTNEEIEAILEEREAS